jgi:hypothetical protein
MTVKSLRTFVRDMDAELSENAGERAIRGKEKLDEHDKNQQIVTTGIQLIYSLFKIIKCL